MVRVVAHQRWEVESNRKSGLAVRQQKLVSRVGFRSGAESGKLPHRPELAAISRGMNSACERKLAGQFRCGPVTGNIERGIERLDHVAGIGE